MKREGGCRGGSAVERGDERKRRPTLGEDRRDARRRNRRRKRRPKGMERKKKAPRFRRGRRKKKGRAYLLE